MVWNLRQSPDQTISVETPLKARLARHPRAGFSGLYAKGLVFLSLAAKCLFGFCIKGGLLEAHSPLDRGLFGQVGFFGHGRGYITKRGILKRQSVEPRKVMPMRAFISRRQTLVGLGGLGLTAFGQTVSLAKAEGVSPSARLAPITPVPEVELRGLSLAGTDTVWISGRGGLVMRGVRGLGLRPHQVPGAEALDYRDIYGHCPLRAVAMSAGPGEASTLWRTETGGRSWDKVFTNPDSEGFFDALTFWTEQQGMVFGDPVGGKFALFGTGDGGKSWSRHDPGIMPDILPGEAAFAASGTCMAANPEGRIAFVTGGDMTKSGGQARVFVSGPSGRDFRAVAVPVPADRPSRGLFSVAWMDRQTLIAVGGDYADPAFEGVNAVISRDGGLSFAPYDAGVRGYLSCVAVSGREVMVTGLGGTAVNGQRLVEAPPMNACMLRSDGSGWLVGPKGRVFRYTH